MTWFHLAWREAGKYGPDLMWSYVLSCFSHVWLFVTLWTVAHQASLSMGFYRQEYWSGLPFPSSGDLPDPEIEPSSFTSPALAGSFFPTSATWDAVIMEPAKYWGLFYHITRKNGYKGQLVVFDKASSWVFLFSIIIPRGQVFIPTILSLPLI